MHRNPSEINAGYNYNSNKSQVTSADPISRVVAKSAGLSPAWAGHSTFAHTFLSKCVSPHKLAGGAEPSAVHRSTTFVKAPHKPRCCPLL